MVYNIHTKRIYAALLEKATVFHDVVYSSSHLTCDGITLPSFVSHSPVNKKMASFLVDDVLLETISEKRYRQSPAVTEILP